MTNEQHDKDGNVPAENSTTPTAAPVAASPEAPSGESPAVPSERPRKRRRRRGRRRGAGAPNAPGASPEGAAPVADASGEEGEPDAEETDDAEPAAEALAAPAEPVDPGPDAAHAPPVAASVRDDGAPADIDPARLDPEGLKILNRLHRYGHEAYFVGGCVRDLLVGRAPKDFDIATSAEPGQVRSLFRNCRLIGRRFRLAHIYFRGGKIIEVSTFRANPLELEAGEELPEDLLITRDNVFGTAEQDARRRDFTINGLFYDIRRGRVIDYVDGLRDLGTRTIRTIGDPKVR
ncbi:MAG: poly(A) polymerase, partial [Myxococcales bacterium]